jgi:predicted N-acetyltransferase YhbS
MGASNLGGLVLRTARPADIPQAGQLLVDRGEESDAGDLERIVATEGCEGVAVVLHGDRVVSTLTLLDEVVHVDEVAVPTGQVDLVATDRDYEGRGLVRALMGWAHERSRASGHLLQVMIGIPYFYRQFGYEYVTPMPPWRPLVATPPTVDGLVVRPASLADIPRLQELQEQAQGDVDVRMGHSPQCWRWLVERDGSLWVAEDHGGVVGMSRTDGDVVAELAAGTDEVLHTLVAHAAAQADEQLSVQQRSAAAAALEPYLGRASQKADWYYARVPDLAALLRHLSPALHARLVSAGMGDREHEVLLSTWRSHLRFAIGPAGFRLLAEGGAEQAPVSKGGSGVPPDAIASLLLGPYGAAGLEERLPDCFLGRQRELMAALFPPRAADLLTFYLPH